MCIVLCLTYLICSLSLYFRLVSLAFGLLRIFNLFLKYFMYFFFSNFFLLSLATCVFCSFVCVILSHLSYAHCGGYIWLWFLCLSMWNVVFFIFRNFSCTANFLFAHKKKDKEESQSKYHIFDMFLLLFYSSTFPLFHPKQRSLKAKERRKRKL